MDYFQAAEAVFVNKKRVDAFTLISKSKNSFSEAAGKGKKIIFIGKSEDKNIHLTKLMN